MEREDSEMKILRVVFVFVYKYIKPKYWNSKTRWKMCECDGDGVKETESNLVQLVYSAVFLFETPN